MSLESFNGRTVLLKQPHPATTQQMPSATYTFYLMARVLHFFARRRAAIGTNSTTRLHSMQLGQRSSELREDSKTGARIITSVGATLPTHLYRFSAYWSSNSTNHEHVKHCYRTTALCLSEMANTKFTAQFQVYFYKFI